MPVPKFFRERGETFERNNDITRDGKHKYDSKNHMKINLNKTLYSKA